MGVRALGSYGGANLHQLISFGILHVSTTEDNRRTKSNTLPETVWQGKGGMFDVSKML